MKPDYQIDETLLNLLNSELSSIDKSKHELSKHYDSQQLAHIYLYLQSLKLYQNSYEYSQSRMIQGKPIASIPVVRDKLETAESLLSIYKLALITQTQLKNLRFFITKVFADVLEHLIQIHGGSGYMQENTSAQLWLACREQILLITQEEKLP